jgi:hypothetical protein
MGNGQSIMKITFEDVQYVIKNVDNYILINTLENGEQNCLIINTIQCENEETIINNYLKKRLYDVKILIYGRNCNDEKIYEKYKQLISLGFYNVYVYVGGLFEWLLLQDIYGEKEFPTTLKELNLLKYKPNKILNISLLQY